MGITKRFKKKEEPPPCFNNFWHGLEETDSSATDKKDKDSSFAGTTFFL